MEGGGGKKSSFTEKKIFGEGKIWQWGKGKDLETTSDG